MLTYLLFKILYDDGYCSDDLEQILVYLYFFIILPFTLIFDVFFLPIELIAIIIYFLRNRKE